MTLLTGGTVRAAFEDDEADDRNSEDIERQYLAGAMEELQVRGHFQGLVERLMPLIPDAGRRQRRAARMVATALITGIARGSTGLPLLEASEDIGVVPELSLLLEVARRLAVDDEREGLFDDIDARSAVEIFEEFRKDFDVSKDFIGSRDQRTPLVVEELDRTVLYTHKTASLERDVSQKVAALLEADDVVDIENAEVHIDDVLSMMPFDMDGGEQEKKRQQLGPVLPGRFSVITGGAGTGKTTMVMTVLRVLDRLPEEQGGLELSEMALAAPTGKAAKRLGISIKDQVDDVRGNDDFTDERIEKFETDLETPKTLHRLLEYSPYFNEFRRDDDNPIDAKLVVVDEASMVGLGMMQALMDALPEDGRLMLVGDAGQLPSVQAGAVFHDLSSTDSGDMPEILRGRICELTENHRVDDDSDAAGNIVKVAGRVRTAEGGSVEVMTDAGLMETVDDVSSTRAGVYFVESDEELPDTEKFVGNWASSHYGDLWPEESDGGDSTGDGTQQETRMYRRRNLFKHTDDGGFVDDARQTLETLFDRVATSQLLTITKVGNRGSRAINRQMHRDYVGRHGLQKPNRFEAGEPVMITKNDYDEDVFNGEQGIVLYTQRPDGDGGYETGKKRIVMKTGEDDDERTTFRAVSFDRLRAKLDWAYALTVHKSQGSEFDHVGIVLPELVDAPGGGEAAKKVHPLMTRQILYTGLTRAKSSVTVFGNPDVFNEGVQRSSGRFSGVKQRILRA